MTEGTPLYEGLGLQHMNFGGDINSQSIMIYKPFTHINPLRSRVQLSQLIVIGCYAYLMYMQRTSLETLGWMKHKLESRLPGEISITSDMQMTPPLWLKVKRN